MNRLGFEELPQHSEKFAKHRKQFCKRLALVHKLIATRFMSDSFSWDCGNNYRCDCGKLITKHHWCMRAFVHRGFTWPESYLHYIKHHDCAPTKAFYIMIVKVTAKRIPLSQLEKKTVNKYISEEQ